MSCDPSVITFLRVRPVPTRHKLEIIARRRSPANRGEHVQLASGVGGGGGGARYRQKKRENRR